MLWMIELLGDTRFIAPMLQTLNKTVFKGRPVKYKTVNAEGIVSVQLLQTTKT